MCDVAISQPTLSYLNVRIEQISDTLKGLLAITEQAIKLFTELSSVPKEVPVQMDTACTMVSNIVNQLQSIALIKRQLEQFFVAANKLRNELILMLNSLVLSIKNANIRFNKSTFHSEINPGVKLNLIKIAIANLTTDLTITDEAEKQVYQKLLQHELQRLYNVLGKTKTVTTQFFLGTAQQSPLNRLATIRKQAMIEREQAEKARADIKPLGIAKSVIPILQNLVKTAAIADIEITPTSEASDVGLVFPVFRARM